MAAMNVPFIVQRRVRAVTERFPRTDGSGFDDVVLNWGAFLTNGGYSGACVRGMDDPDAGVSGDSPSEPSSALAGGGKGYVASR